MKLTVYAIDGITPVVDPTAYVHPSRGADRRRDRRAGLLHRAVRQPARRLRPPRSARRRQPAGLLRDARLSRHRHDRRGGRPHRPRRRAARLHRPAQRAGRHERRGQRQRGRSASRRSSRRWRSSRRASSCRRARWSRACRRRIVRELTEQEMAWKVEGTRSYQELTRRSLATMTRDVAAGGARARIASGSRCSELLPLSRS